MVGNRQYDHEYKVQAVKLAKEIGQAKAAEELGVPRNTIPITVWIMPKYRKPLEPFI